MTSRTVAVITVLTPTPPNPTEPPVQTPERPDPNGPPNPNVPPDPNESPGQTDLPERILDHYEDPYHRGTLDRPSRRDQGVNPLCGDVVQIDLRVAGGVIEEAWFEAEGCVLSSAAASLLCERIEGESVDAARGFTASDMLALVGDGIGPTRRKCVLLPWRVLASALEGEEDDGDDSAAFGGPSLGEES